MSGEKIIPDAPKGEASVPDEKLRIQSSVLERIAGLTAVQGSEAPINSGLAI